jgi:hypothetical protein
MAQYNITVQDKPYKTITTTDGYNYGTIAADVYAGIASGAVSIDYGKPINIGIIPITT